MKQITWRARLKTPFSTRRTLIHKFLRGYYFHYSLIIISNDSRNRRNEKNKRRRERQRIIRVIGTLQGKNVPCMLLFPGY